MVDWELIKKLIQTVKEEGISGLSIEEKGIKYEVRSEGGKVVSHAPIAVVPHAIPQAPAKVEAGSASSEEDGFLAITSPMVGTFYRAPSPEAAPFVEVGETVSPGKAVCIIEAMKLFNEIEAEISGKIVKILVENGQSVEYGQKLMLIQKN